MPVPVMDRDRLGGTATRQQGQGFDTRKAAEQYNAGVIASLHSGQYVVPNKITTGEYLTGWLGAIRSTIKVSTRKGLVIRSVARDADPPRSSTTTADSMRTWTGAETGQFLKQVVDHRFGAPICVPCLHRLPPRRGVGVTVARPQSGRRTAEGQHPADRDESGRTNRRRDHQDEPGPAAAGT
jgi:hypothetical protein